MPKLSAIRKDLARRAGRLQEFPTGVLYASLYQGTASGSDGARRVISSELAAINLAGTGPGIMSTAKTGEWVWIPWSGEQRRILSGGYNAYATATSVLTGQNVSADNLIVGYVTLDRPLAAVLPPDTDIEITDRFPVLSSESLPGLHWAINEALSLMHWPRSVTVTAVTGTARYDLSTTAPWFTDPGQFVRAYRHHDDSTQGPVPMAGKAWVEPDGEKIYFNIPANETVTTGENFTIQVRMPALNWINVKRQARFTVTITGGAVSAVTVVDGGLGYTSVPTMTVTGTGSSATLTAVVTNGSVTSVTVNAGGSGYAQGSTVVTASAPTGTWASSTVGLVNDDDEAIIPVDRVSAVAYAILARRMVKNGPKPQAAEWAAEADAAEKEVRDILEHQPEPMTPQTNRLWAVPKHPMGRSWRPATLGVRRGWP